MAKGPARTEQFALTAAEKSRRCKVELTGNAHAGVGGFEIGLVYRKGWLRSLGDSTLS